jgi:hypothetical protein
MATTNKSKMPSDDQMLDDSTTAHALHAIVSGLRKRYPNDPDLMMAQRCLGEFKPTTSFQPQRGVERPSAAPRKPRPPARQAVEAPERETMQSIVVEKGK